MNGIDLMLKATDNFISKRKRQNEPYQAFLKTDDYARMRSIIKDGIGKQIKWVGNELPKIAEAGILADDYMPMTADQKAKLGHYLINRMPKAAEYISETKLTATLLASFVWGVKAQYNRFGLLTKVFQVDFNLTNDQYIAALKNQANYLLNRSSIDNTTIEQIINIIGENKIDGLTIDEIASVISDSFDEISDARSFVIANTETNNAMSSGQKAAMVENGVQTKSWIPAGAKTCPYCESNADDGVIGINETFSSGDDIPPAHPNCECYLEAGEINLESISIWDGE